MGRAHIWSYRPTVRLYPIKMTAALNELTLGTIRYCDVFKTKQETLLDLEEDKEATEIGKTYPCDADPLIHIPYFRIVKLGYTDIRILFSFKTEWRVGSSV